MVWDGSKSPAGGGRAASIQEYARRMKGGGPQFVESRLLSYVKAMRSP